MGILIFHPCECVPLNTHCLNLGTHISMAGTSGWLSQYTWMGLHPCGFTEHLCIPCGQQSLFAWVCTYCRYPSLNEVFRFKPVKNAAIVHNVQLNPPSCQEEITLSCAQFQLVAWSGYWVAFLGRSFLFSSSKLQSSKRKKTYVKIRW